MDNLVAMMQQWIRDMETAALYAEQAETREE